MNAWRGTHARQGVKGSGPASPNAGRSRLEKTRAPAEALQRRKGAAAMATRGRSRVAAVLGRVAARLTVVAVVVVLFLLFVVAGMRGLRVVLGLW